MWYEKRSAKEGENRNDANNSLEKVDFNSNFVGKEKCNCPGWFFFSGLTDQCYKLSSLNRSSSANIFGIFVRVDLYSDQNRSRANFFLVKYSTPYSSIYGVFALAITKGLSLSQFRLSPTSISQLQGCQGSISFLFAPHPLGFSSKWFWETETGGRGRGLNINGEWEGGIGIRPTPALCEAKWSRIFQPRVESGPDTANASLGSKGDQGGQEERKTCEIFSPSLILPPPCLPPFLLPGASCEYITFTLGFIPALGEAE